MYQIIIQQVSKNKFVPKKTALRKWIETALTNQINNAEVTIRIVEKEEMTYLNETYRKKSGPTNVLSFPFSVPKEVELEFPILGDIIICADIVNQEAHDQNKTEEAHWAHMIVHGTLHLLGFDHEEAIDAEKMENLEIEILKRLGFNNPYETGEQNFTHE